MTGWLGRLQWGLLSLAYPLHADTAAAMPARPPAGRCWLLQVTRFQPPSTSPRRPADAWTQIG